MESIKNRKVIYREKYEPLVTHLSEKLEVIDLNTIITEFNGIIDDNHEEIEKFHKTFELDTSFKIWHEIAKKMSISSCDSNFKKKTPCINLVIKPVFIIPKIEKSYFDDENFNKDSKLYKNIISIIEFSEIINTLENMNPLANNFRHLLQIITGDENKNDRENL